MRSGHTDLGPPFDTLIVSSANGITRVTIRNPPINLLDGRMMADLERLSIVCADDAELRVIVFDSANPDYFIAHADLTELLGRGDPSAERRDRLSRFAEMTERFRTLPAVSVAVVEGRARGGGSEFLLALDLRYAAAETARFGQPEVGFGLLPGGGATQRLPRLVGRSRALEIMLTADDYDAEQAERCGWITQVLPQAELRTHVDRVARRIAAFSADSIAAVKLAVEHADERLEDGLKEEHGLFRRILATDDAQDRMSQFLRAGGQTYAAELDLGRRLGPVEAGVGDEGATRWRLLGSWSLDDYEVVRADGVRSRPLGPSPSGMLVYAPDGAVSALLCRTAHADAGDQASDGRSYIAYAGTYSVDDAGARVTHDVDVSLIPEWRGRSLQRSIGWDGDRLILTADVVDPRGAATHVLTWRRRTVDCQ